MTVKQCIVERIVAAAGGQTALANGIGARQQEVWKWLKAGRIPEGRCPVIEHKYGFACEEIRPDVPWARLPDAAWPGGRGRPVIDHFILHASASAEKTEGSSS